MKLGKTSIYVTFCISANHPKGYIDENAIKAVLNEASRTLANELLSFDPVVTEEGEAVVSSVGVRVSKLDIEGKTVNLKTFGTDAVRLEPHYQTEYKP